MSIMTKAPTVRLFHTRLFHTLMAMAVTLVVASACQLPSSPVAGTSAAPSLLTTPDLLQDPSFETGFAPWSVWPGDNYAIYSGGAAEDNNYLETNTGSAGSGGSVYQDVAISALPSHGYTASVYLRSPSGAPISVDLVLWALGSPPVQVGKTSLTISSTSWASSSVEVDIPTSAYIDLRLQIYVGTTGVNLDVDGANLADAGLANPSFERGFPPWVTWPGENYAVYRGDAAEDDNYLETNTGSAGSGGSVYQDVSAIPIVGHSYDASVMLRSPTGTSVTVTLALWALGGPFQNEAGTSNITISSAQWSRHNVELDVTESAHTDFRLQVYVQTTGANVDVDAATLTDAGLVNSSFEHGISGWGVYGASTSVVTNSSQAPEDANYLEFQSASVGGSVYQDVATTLLLGHAYTASALLRSPSGTPMTVDLVLWALGGAPTIMAKTEVTVSSPNWTRYGVELDLPANGYNDLRFQVYEGAAHVNLDVDSTLLPEAAISPTATPGAVRGVGVYGFGSRQAAALAISDGWPVLGATGGLGTTGSPYTTAVGSPGVDASVAAAIAAGNRAVTWLSFWTVSAPSASDTWSNAGYLAGQTAAATIVSASSSVRPTYVILDPEGYNNGQPNDYPSTTTGWASWTAGWVQGIHSVSPALNAALYVDQYQYQTFSLNSIGVPVFIAVSPILGNTPFVNGPNITGYIAFTGGCPAAPYESTMLSWGGSYSTMEFGDNNVDCAP
jgi:hypothetical protein